MVERVCTGCQPCEGLPIPPWQGLRQLRVCTIDPVQGVDRLADLVKVRQHDSGTVSTCTGCVRLTLYRVDKWCRGCTQYLAKVFPLCKVYSQYPVQDSYPDRVLPHNLNRVPHPDRVLPCNLNRVQDPQRGAHRVSTGCRYWQGIHKAYPSVHLCVNPTVL